MPAAPCGPAQHGVAATDHPSSLRSGGGSPLNTSIVGQTGKVAVEEESGSDRGMRLRSVDCSDDRLLRSPGRRSMRGQRMAARVYWPSYLPAGRGRFRSVQAFRLGGSGSGRRCAMVLRDLGDLRACHAVLSSPEVAVRCQSLPNKPLHAGERGRRSLERPPMPRRRGLRPHLLAPVVPSRRPFGVRR